MTNRPNIGSYYYHYKHDPEQGLLDHCYQVAGVAKHTETEELMVAYKPMYLDTDNRTKTFFTEVGADMAVRPLEMWSESVEWQGQTVPRFRELADEELIKIQQEAGFTHTFYNHDSEVLNNFSPHPVFIFDRQFATAEHAYQYAKHMDTTPEVAEQVATAKTPMETKHIANHPDNKPKRNPNWESDKVEVMRQVLIAKLDQNEEVRQFLISSGQSQLAEDSPTDMFWGVEGENVLGKLWMEIRENLIKQQSYE